MKLLSLWPAPNVPGTNGYRITIPTELDTRQEFARVDYNINTNWTLTGRYLHDQVDSRGEYVTQPDVAPGQRYQVGHLAVLEARRAAGRVLHELSYQLSSHTQSARDVLRRRDDLGVRDSRVLS